MNLGTFPVFVISSYLFIAISTPFISLFFLRRERQANIDILGLRTFLPGFLLGVLVWILVVSVAGFALLMFLGMFVYVNAHVGANADASVPIVPLLLVFGMGVLLVFVGCFLHRRVSDSLWQEPKSTSNNSFDARRDSSFLKSSFSFHVDAGARPRQLNRSAEQYSESSCQES